MNTMESTGSLNMTNDFSSNMTLNELRPGSAKPLQQQVNFDLKHGRIDRPPRTAKSVFKSMKQKCAVDKDCFLTSLLHVFPLVDFIKTYKLREYILGDIVSGLTVGVMTVPQSMAYAILASVPPILGLYTSVFPVFVHLIFGAAPYIGMGVMALSSLLTGTVVRRETAHLEEQLKNAIGNDTAALRDQLHQEQIAIATTLAFMSGVIALLMAIFRLGFVTSYLGSALIAGFFTGSNITVITHQVRLIMGVPVGAYSGVLSYVYMVWDMLRNIKHTNITQVIISIICCVILIVVKKCVNERFRARLKVPVPIELIVVTLATIVSHFAKFEKRFGVEIVGEIPTGVPAPVLPRADKFLSLLPDSITLAIICYVLVFLMVKMLGERHDLEIHPNQDLFAMGMCNIISSFFSCMASSSSPPRSLIMDSTGGRTQLSFVVSSVVVLLFLFALAPLLESLPVCVLASLVIVACIPIFQYYKQSVLYWRSSKYDFAIYVITMLGVLLWNISAGLAFGIAASFFIVVFRTQRPYVTTLSSSADKETLLDSKKYSPTKDIPKIKVFRFESPLYFATLEIFKRRLYSATVKPADLKPGLKTQIQDAEKNVDAEKTAENNGPNRGPSEDVESAVDPKVANDQNHKEGVAEPLVDKPKNMQLKFVIIDCSGITFVDTSGAKTLLSLYNDYSAVGVTMLLTGCTETVRDMLYKVPECQSLTREALYISAGDAVNWASNAL